MYTQSPNPIKKKNKSRSTLSQLLVIMSGVLVISLVLCLFTLSPWAKYGTSGSGEDGARVARFEVNVEDSQTDKDLDFDPSDTDNLTQTYTFSVSNQSSTDNTIINEVATNYDVKVTFPSEFTKADTGLDMTLVNDNGTASDTTDDTTTTGTTTDNKTYTFLNVGVFKAAQAQTASLKLTFVLDADNAQEGEWKNISIDVTATQID